MVSLRLRCLMGMAIAIMSVDSLFSDELQTLDDRTLPEPPAIVLQAQQARIAAMAKASLSTVGVFGVEGEGGGSGVIITADGYVVTNYHVTRPFGNRMRCGTSDGKMHDAVIVSIDPTGDLALIKMESNSHFVPAIMADSDQVRVGHWCFAAGNPFVLATNLQPTITYGIISGVRRYQYPAGTILEYTDCLQTDAAINPGNSGGPLFDAQGDLIGINGRCSFEKRSRVNVGVGYAISINQVKRFLGQLRSGRLVDHATIGFTVATSSDNKVVVSNILESSDAFRRGIRYGDELLSLANRSIQTTNEMKNVLGTFPCDWRIPVTYRNASGEHETWVRLPRLHREEELWKLIEGENGPHEHEPKPPKPQGEAPLDEPEKPSPGDAKKSAQTKENGDSDKEDPLADRFIERAGYINYYFNKLELDRVLSKQQHISSAWKNESAHRNFRGKVLGEPTEVEIVFEPTGQVMRLGSKETRLRAGPDWSSCINDQQNSCLAIGLHLWMRWHRDGAMKLGDTHYFGEAPILGNPKLFDVVRTTVGELICMVYSEPETGKIRLIELQADTDRDVAEVYFEYAESTQGLAFPSKMRLGFGTDSLMAIELTATEASIESQETPK